MSEIIELNGFGSQDRPNRVNNADPVITPRLPFLPHPTGRALHHGQAARTQAAPAASSHAPSSQLQGESQGPRLAEISITPVKMLV